MIRARTAGVGLVLAATALGLAACGGHQAALGPGSYTHPSRHVPGTSAPKQPAGPSPKAPPAAGTTHPATTTPSATTPEPSYLHPPSGQPWAVRGSAPWAAAQYVTAEATSSWQWSTPAQYLYDARPFMTPAFYRLQDHYELKALVAMGTSGTDTFWQRQKVTKDGDYVVIDFAYTITEAGVTPSSQVVRVAYWLGLVTDGVTEPVNRNDALSIEDLLLHKIGGRWLVASVQPDEAG